MFFSIISEVRIVWRNRILRKGKENSSKLSRDTFPTLYTSSKLLRDTFPTLYTSVVCTTLSCYTFY